MVVMMGVLRRPRQGWEEVVQLGDPQVEEEHDEDDDADSDPSEALADASRIMVLATDDHDDTGESAAKGGAGDREVAAASRIVGDIRRMARRSGS